MLIGFKISDLENSKSFVTELLYIFPMYKNINLIHLRLQQVTPKLGIPLDSFVTRTDKLSCYRLHQTY